MKKRLILCTAAAVLASAPGPSRAEVTTVPSVDLNRYIGTWYEVASLPQRFQKQCVANTTAEYSLTDDDLIKVVNSCEKADRSRSVAEGRAKVVDRESNSKLKVTFVRIFGWIFAFGGSYWIIDLAPDYSFALIGDPSAKYAWLLSRTPSISRQVLVHAEEKFRSAGYDTCQILTSVQNGGFEKRVPLCEAAK